MATTIERLSTISKGIKVNDLIIRFAGEAGEGVVSSGKMIGDAFVRYNLKIFTYQTIPAEIMGGTVMYQLRTNSKPVRSRGDVPDAFVVLTQEGYDKHQGDVPNDVYTVYNSDEVKGDFSRFTASYGIPMDKMGREAGDLKVKYTVGVGAVAAMLHMDLAVYEDLTRRRINAIRQAKREIAKLKEAGTYVEGMDAPITTSNLNALRAGYAYMKTLMKEHDAEAPFTITAIEGSGNRVVTTGNRMIALGSIAAGCRFYAGYPITPATDIMEELARFLPQFGGSVLQVEDEIAALGVVLGASYAGMKAMTATSGPGVSLMIEMLGLASMLELPVVIVDAMRAGPSTGMPTKPEQGDLYMAAYAGHGDSPRIVLAPSTVADCFWVMQSAFNLAEKYQMPVLVLTDQALASRNESIERPDISVMHEEHRLVPTPEEIEHFARFEITETGISPFAVPGTKGGTNFATGVEHDEGGNIKHDPWVHREMTQKRFRKLDTAIAEGDLDGLRTYGDPTATVGIIAWGTNLGIIQDAIDIAAAEGHKVEFVCPTTVFPVVKHELAPYIEKWDKILVIENNFQGQYLTLLRDAFAGCSKFEPIHKYEGVPFAPAEIVKVIQEATR
ncbi:MAG: 2-oxoacid:acceptor oxidoreductase subunit alpha [bacterium]